MRVVGGHITNFAPFTQKALPELRKDMILFYGDNESGKSSLFEFLKRMMFQPEKSSRLKKGSRLKDIDGTLVITEQNSTPVTIKPDSKVRHLPEYFQNIFVINLDDLSKNSNEKVDKTIVEAAIGGIDYSKLKDCIEQMDATTTEIFLKSGNAKNRLANDLLSKIDDTNNQLRAIKKELGNDTYKNKQDNIAKLETQILERRRKIAILESELQQLTLFVGILPSVTAYQQAANALAGCDWVTDSEKNRNWFDNWQRLQECEESIKHSHALLTNSTSRLDTLYAQAPQDLSDSDKDLLNNRDGLDLLHRDASGVSGRIADIADYKGKLSELKSEFMLEIEPFDSNSAIEGYSPELLEVLQTIDSETKDALKKTDDLQTLYIEYEQAQSQLDVVKGFYESVQQGFDAYIKSEKAQLTRYRMIFGSLTCISLVAAIGLYYYSLIDFALILLGVFVCFLICFFLYAKLSMSINMKTAEEAVNKAEMNVENSQSACDNLKSRITYFVEVLAIDTPLGSDSINEFIKNLQMKKERIDGLFDCAKSIQDCEDQIAVQLSPVNKWMANAEELKSKTPSLPWSEQKNQWISQIIQWCKDLQTAMQKQTRLQEYQNQIEAESNNQKKYQATLDRHLSQQSVLLAALKCVSTEDANRKNENFRKMFEAEKQVHGISRTIDKSLLDEIDATLGEDKGASRKRSIEENLTREKDILETDVVAKGKLEEECLNIATSRQMENLINTKEQLLFKLRACYRQYVLLLTERMLLDKAQKDFVQTMTFFKNCSNILSVITDGKWITFEQNLSGEYVLVDCDNHSYIIKDYIEKLSRGTIEQLYLSIRLAFAIEYRRETTSIPIILDDVFVNFDDDRQINILRALLSQIAIDGQQVIMFAASKAFAVTAKNVLQDTVQIIRIENRSFIPEEF